MDDDSGGEAEAAALDLLENLPESRPATPLGRGPKSLRMTTETEEEEEQQKAQNDAVVAADVAADCPIAKLPDEVLLMVMRLLPVHDLLLRVPLTCRRFARIAKDPALQSSQVLCYAECDDDGTFIASLQRASSLYRLDLSGLRADSEAEKYLDLMEEDKALHHLVLSDDMRCGVAVRLLRRTLGTLESLYVGRMQMSKASYSELLRLVFASNKLASLRLGATVANGNAGDVNFCPRPRPDSALQRLEVWSEGDMPVFAVCCLIRANAASLTYFSHEFMSFKPAEPQERRILDAIAQCQNLASVRLWSSKGLRALDGLASLRALGLTCEGECRDEEGDTFACEDLLARSAVLPRLRHLCLRLLDCQSGVRPLQHIAQRCPDIEELVLNSSALDVGGASNQHFRVLRRLRCLTLYGAQNVAPDFLDDWDEDTLPELKKLTIYGSAKFCPVVCYANHVRRLRARRPDLAVYVKECVHFARLSHHLVQKTR